MIPGLADLLSMSLTVPGWIAGLVMLLCGYLAGCAFSARVHIERANDEALWWRENSNSIAPAEYRRHKFGIEPDTPWPRRSGAGGEAS